MISGVQVMKPFQSQAGVCQKVITQRQNNQVYKLGEVYDYNSNNTAE